MTGLEEMTSELQPHAPVRMPKYLQACITHASLPLDFPFVQPVSFETQPCGRSLLLLLRLFYVLSGLIPRH